MSEEFAWTSLAVSEPVYFHETPRCPSRLAESHDYSPMEEIVLKRAFCILNALWRTCNSSRDASDRRLTTLGTAAFRFWLDRRQPSLEAETGIAPTWKVSASAAPKKHSTPPAPSIAGLGQEPGNGPPRNLRCHPLKVVVGAFSGSMTRVNGVVRGLGRCAGSAGLAWYLLLRLGPGEFPDTQQY
jgi:hypothetical protein